MPLKSKRGEGHENKKKADTFLMYRRCTTEKMMSYSIGFIRSHMN